MRISAISNTGNTNFRGCKDSVDRIIESKAETLETKINPNRKTISIELHNALVKLSIYKTILATVLLSGAASGSLGYIAGDKMADSDNDAFATTVQSTGLDSSATFEIKDMNKDGSADLVFRKPDSTMIILDLKNSNVFVETKDCKEIQ